MGRYDNYVPVHVRLLQFKDKYGDLGCIHTTTTINEEKGTVTSTAAVVLSFENGVQRMLANATAYGHDISEEKEVEKIQSIAVGKALGLAGFSADASLASAEEMEDFETKTVTPTKSSGFGKKVETDTTEDDDDTEEVAEEPRQTIQNTAKSFTDFVGKKKGKGLSSLK